MQTIHDFIRKHGITAEFERVPERTGDETWGNQPHFAYDVTLRRPGGRKLKTPFQTGTGIAWPELADVLNCLASDASGIRNADGFEDWASEYGMPIEDWDDVRKAKKGYTATQKQTDKLARFLDADELDELLHNTEQL